MTLPRTRRGRAVLLLTAVAAAATIAALVIARPARADEATRNRLMAEINQLLSDMASALSNVPGDSGTSYVDSALAKSEYVYDKANDLKYNADDNSDAKRMGDYYPDYARKFQDAVKYLREMKTSQRKLDEWPRKCEDAQRELVAKMRGYTDSGDPRGLEEVPKLAREAARVGKELLEQAERTRYEMYAWNDRVDDFSASDGKWSDVRSYLIGAGAAVYKYLLDKQEQLKRDDVCGNLAKDDRNPLVEEAMKKLAEGKRGIEGLYDAMDRQLSEIASSLDRLEGDSSDSDISAAESKLGELERNLDQLDRVKGNDGEARRRLELYRNIARAAREAWKQLRVLKLAQFAADLAPQKCRESSERLRELIRGYVDKSEPRGVKEIPLRARGFAEPIKAGLAKTDEQHAVMERALADAQRFDPSEGRWRDVTGKHRASASAMFEYWKKAREAAHAACDELAKGDEARDVKDAVQKLAGEESSANDRAKRRIAELTSRWTALQAEYKQTESAVWAGINDSRRLRKFDTDELNQLIVFMCSQDQEKDGDEADRLSQDMGNRLVSAARGRLDEYVKGADANQARLEAIYRDLRTFQADSETALKDNEALTAVDKGLLAPLREMIAAVAALRDKDRSKLFGMLASDRQAFVNASDDVLKGQSNPRVAASNKYGRAKHRELQRDSQFACAEVEFAAGGGFADCVSHAQCTVWEFKPSSWTIDQAERQARDYVGGVESAFSKSNAAGKPWEQCWRADGPSGGRGYIPRGYAYPKCE
ncbi:MAG: hypothetical protein IPL61_32800 [Myxococcales bacterium]|nr:hypothetical protein [Myxococcales bacterium]